MLMVLDQDSRKWLSSLLGDNVRFDEPMSRHTSLRVGGPAEVYATPEKPEALAEVIKEARQRGIAYLVIGDGTNLLVKDGGLTGIVIVLKKCLKDVFQKGSETTACASSPWPVPKCTPSVRLLSGRAWKE